MSLNLYLNGSPHHTTGGAGRRQIAGMTDPERFTQFYPDILRFVFYVPFCGRSCILKDLFLAVGCHFRPKALFTSGFSKRHENHRKAAAGNAEVKRSRSLICPTASLNCGASEIPS